MGNNVGAEAGGGFDELSQPVSATQKTKAPNSPRATSYAADQQELTVATAKTKSANETIVATAPNSSGGVDENDDDVSPLQLLLSFIPYYGQGDPSNDSIVRATLSSLSIEDIDSRDEYGNTLLVLVCQYKCEDLVRIMLNKGADPNAANYSGVCGLHHASYRESHSVAIAKLLLQNGANPEVAESTYGCTPLHYCAGAGDLEFCKLLITYGAQIGTLDYYKYTCVDYARDAGMTAVAEVLQARLAKERATLTRSTSMYGGYESPSSKQAAGMSEGSFMNAAAQKEWGMPYIDPSSGEAYYVNTVTGDTIWESDLRLKLQSQPPPPSSPSSKRSSMDVSRNPETPATVGSSSTAEAIDPALIIQALRVKLIAFFSRYEPSRLVEVESLIENYRTREEELFKELCVKYNASMDDPDAMSLLKRLKTMYASGATISTPYLKKTVSLAATEFELGKSTPVALRGFQSSLDMGASQQLEKETRQKYEAQMDEERSNFRAIISEKDGSLSRLQSELDALKRDKARLEHEISSMKAKLERAQQQGGEALTSIEAQLTILETSNNLLKSELLEARQQIGYEQERLRSLELATQKLNLGHEETMLKEKAEAEERARQQREKDALHAKELQEYEIRFKNLDQTHKAEFAKAKHAWDTQERSLKNAHAVYQADKQRELDSILSEMAEFKSKSAKEISAAQMMAEDYRKVSEENIRRADAAEALQLSMANEIVEARGIQQFNAQLHKDILREQVARRRLHNEMEDLKGKIRVYVRIRPMSESELQRGSTEAVIKDGKLSLYIKPTGDHDTKKVYDFDQVFGGPEGNSQEDIFRDTKHLIMSVVDGFNVCIFAYGQTGAGKSYTMIGSADIGNCLLENGDFDSNAGITPRAVSELFRLLNERHAQVTYEVQVQMFQLYRDGLEDLLAGGGGKKKKGEEEMSGPLKITLAEHSASGLVQVEGANMMVAENPGDVMKIFAKGSARRATASTKMNAESSRSHLICSLVVKLTNRRSGQASIGKLTLVDLAGSERVDKSGAIGETLKEAQSINKSLSALGDVIAALTSGQNHVPYRNHPLTMLMSDSIGGNAKTLMFVNASPADYNTSESNNSLSFASRCKDITNAVASNPAVQQAQLNALKKELTRLKKTGGGKPGAGGLARPV